jgi:hypothetical protein
MIVGSDEIFLRIIYYFTRYYFFGFISFFFLRKKAESIDLGSIRSQSDPIDQDQDRHGLNHFLLFLMMV